MEYLEVFAIVLLVILVLVFVRYRRYQMKEKKKAASVADGTAKKPAERNGNDDDIAIFADRLMRFAKREKIRLIMPGIISCNGTVTQLSAILVGHGGILGVYCIGYGGTITIPSDVNAENWQQEINGRTRNIRNPLRNCRKLNGEVEAAMAALAMPVHMRTVPVFTTPKVSLHPVPQNVFTTDSFFYYLDNADWVGEGSLNMDAIADDLQAMVPMDELKAAEKARKEAEKAAKKKR